MQHLVKILAASGFLAVTATAAPASDVHPQDVPLTGNLQGLDREQVLDRLFGRLHRIKNPKSAKVIAQAIWRTWSRSESPTATVLLRQAQRAMKARQYRVAIAILSALIGEHPQFAEAWNKRATAYFLIGDFDRSLADIDKVLALEPRHFGALSGLGHIHHNLGNHARALSAFRRAHAIHPHLPDVNRAIKKLSAKAEQDI